MCEVHYFVAITCKCVRLQSLQYASCYVLYNVLCASTKPLTLYCVRYQLDYITSVHKHISRPSLIWDNLGERSYDIYGRNSMEHVCEFDDTLVHTMLSGSCLLLSGRAPWIYATTGPNLDAIGPMSIESTPSRHYPCSLWYNREFS